MKKKLLILTLSLGLLIVGETTAFADSENTFVHGYGNGHGFYNSDLTIEEIHASKIERINQLVTDGKITAAQGETYMTQVTERQATCDGLGTNRDDHERLGIGFEEGLRDGSGSGSGMASRGGYHGGFGNR
ncbi:MAG: hypothetical protein WBA54_12400 [Acidaminobacteraceae bacterium]